MHRPIGVILLAAGAGLAGLAQLYRMLVYLGVFSFELNSKELFVQDTQWGAALWADIDGDGRDEVVIPTENVGIVALDAEGNSLWKYRGAKGGR